MLPVCDVVASQIKHHIYMCKCAPHIMSVTSVWRMRPAGSRKHVDAAIASDVSEVEVGHEEEHVHSSFGHHDHDHDHDHDSDRDDDEDHDRDHDRDHDGEGGACALNVVLTVSATAWFWFILQCHQLNLEGCCASCTCRLTFKHAIMLNAWSLGKHM